MTNARVSNLTRGYSMRFRQAMRGVEQCAMAWVEPGVSVRDLSLAESIAARNEQARLREPMAAAEIPGLRFEAPAAFAQAAARSRRLAREADIFAQQAGQ